ERRLVHAHLSGFRPAGDGERGVHAAPRQRLLDPFPHLGLERVEPRRQTQAKIEPAVVHAPELPVPERAVEGTVAAGEPGHALKRHGIVPRDVRERGTRTLPPPQGPGPRAPPRRRAAVPRLRCTRSEMPGKIWISSSACEPASEWRTRPLPQAPPPLPRCPTGSELA